MKKLILIAALAASFSAQAVLFTDRKTLSPKEQVLLKECETAHALGSAYKFMFSTRPDDRNVWTSLSRSRWDEKYGPDATTDLALKYENKNILKNRFGENISSPYNYYSCYWTGGNYKLHKDKP